MIVEAEKKETKSDSTVVTGNEEEGGRRKEEGREVSIEAFEDDYLQRRGQREIQLTLML